MSQSSIHVTVRVRPFSIREAAQIAPVDDNPTFFGDGLLAGPTTPKLTGKGLRRIVKVVDDQMLIFDPPENNPMAKFQKSILPQGKRVKDVRFGFDRIFDENVTQQEVYECTTRNLLGSVLEGFNATVFAYGATGCGKTHTISGNPQNPGIIFLTCAELFERIDALKDEKEIELTMSYLEIYNETIRDLLVEGGSSKALALREDSTQTISVAGLSTHCPKDVNEVMHLIMMGNSNRTMSPTEANATSSRSHAVLQINVNQRDKASGLQENHTAATLSIIDLAGSERASVTKNRGDRLLEGANINRSLLALGNCINALCDPTRRNHVPYRDSKLTRLLKFSLGGNCKTVMIVCVSPSSQHYDETHNTLKYANRAKNIKTKVSRNMINVNRHVSQYVKAIYELTQEVEGLKKKLNDSTKEAMDKLKKQEVQRLQQIQEGSKRLRTAYEHSQNMRDTRIQDFKNLRLIEHRIALVTAWTSAFDTVFSKGEAPPKALLTVRAEAEKVLQELENNLFGLQHRLQGPTAEREIDRALDATLRNLQAIEGVTDADIASVNAEATLYKTMIDRDFFQNLAEVNADMTKSISVLSKAHFETVASLNQLNLQDDSASDAVRETLQTLMKTCTEAASQVIKPNGELTFSQENFSIPRVNFDTPRKKATANSVLMNLASPLRGPFAQVVPGVSTTPLVRPSPRAFKVGTPKTKAVLFAKKSPKKVKRVRWQDETEAEEKLDILEENKRYRAEKVHHLSTSSSASISAADSSFAHVISSSTSVATSHRHPSDSSLSSFSTRNYNTNSESSYQSHHEKHIHAMDQPPTRRNNKMEMGFLSKSKQRDNSPPPLPRPPSHSYNRPTSSSNNHATTTINGSVSGTPASSINNPRSQRNEFPLSETDTSILNNHKLRPSTIYEDLEDNTTVDVTRVWRSTTSSTKAALMVASAKRRVSSGGMSGPATRARRSRTHHSSPESSNTAVQFKTGHARRMSTVPEKENVSGRSHGHEARHGVLSPKASGAGFKREGARRITISGRGELGAGGRRTSLAPLVREAVKAQSSSGMVAGATKPTPWR
ncbi:P-loop containing nucleoside triphosphate hydrolase protein [Tirmania nivea]|nr:P-loop containing nucleoside triphosphate hydrolase protein [Tirmania nivea]